MVVTMIGFKKTERKETMNIIIDNTFRFISTDNYSYIPHF